MSFADELKAKTNDYHSKVEEKPTKDDFVNDRIQKYVVDIKKLCTEAASKGEKTIKGFFVPYRVDYNYETTCDGPLLLEKPTALINKRPSVSASGGLYGGAAELNQAVITLHDGQNYRLYGAVDMVDDAMIESVRIGIINKLVSEGFKTLEINHLVGPKYVVSSKLFNAVIKKGTRHYFYLEIEW